ncbi:hypothetical protein TSOC_014697, partial [Tetrabaena socialis]
QPSLSLSPAEFQELLSSFNEQCAGGGFQDPVLQNGLFTMTAGQVGMVTCVLDHILSKIRNQPLEQGLVDKTARESLYNALGNQRSFINLDEFTQYRDVLEAVLSGGDIWSEKTLVMANRLVRVGLMVDQGSSRFSFASPLHENFYLVQVYRGSVNYIKDNWYDFDTFIKLSIQRMSSCCCTSWMPQWMSTVAPAVSNSSNAFTQVFGSKGYMDFWISLGPEAGWGIELLCDGDRANEHANVLARARGPGARGGPPAAPTGASGEPVEGGGEDLTPRLAHRIIASLSQQHSWKAGTWRFDGRKNLFFPDELIPREARTWQVKLAARAGDRSEREKIFE